ncbi:hypothetical protein [Thiocapsa sp.]|uniref:hypothetical protein n=1 Tax=Thiocapsa sp. TaxID=2024551 RepID=UPI00359308EE
MFQGQPSDKAWHNLLTKIALYGEEHPRSDVVGIAIFLREQDVPAFQSWANHVVAPLLQVVLRRVLPDGWRAIRRCWNSGFSSDFAG